MEILLQFWLSVASVTSNNPETPYIINLPHLRGRLLLSLPMPRHSCTESPACCTPPRRPLHGSTHVPQRHLYRGRGLPLQLPASRLERPPCSQLPPSRIASPVRYPRPRAGASTLPTATSEAHRLSRHGGVSDASIIQLTEQIQSGLPN